MRYAITMTRPGQERRRAAQVMAATPGAQGRRLACQAVTAMRRAAK